jgi:hypothetical protein
VPACGFEGEYIAGAVDFDGTNDYLTRGAGLTGAADSKLWTGSLWINSDADGLFYMLIAASTTVGGSTLRIFVYKGTTNRLIVSGRNPAGTTIVDIQSAANSIEAADGWVHAMWSCDLADTAKRHVYINDADQTAIATYTNDTIDFTWADWSIGALPNGTDKLNGQLADVLMWPGVYVDLSVATNRRLFISAAGKPVEQTAATTVLGTPAIWLSGPTVDWHTNKGGGGGFTENGALTDAATSPSA